MTAQEIVKSLTGSIGKWSPHKVLVVPNSTNVSNWESDLLVIQPSGWCEEVEIKISVSDFRAELRNKQDKHQSIERGHLLIPQWDYSGPFTEPRKPKEPLKVPTIIRRFWFAMPEDVFEKVKDEIPQWAGVLVILLEKRDKWSYCYPWREERPAKNLPARKCEETERLRLLMSVYHRAWNNGWAAPKESTK